MRNKTLSTNLPKHTPENKSITNMYSLMSSVRSSHLLRGRFSSMMARAYSSNITYSGGHPSEGQGGYYGSGGARHIKFVGHDDRPTLVAMVEDVNKIAHIMKELETLEHLLQRELEDSKGEVTGKSIEIRSSIKKLMTSSEVMNAMARLEHDGEPTWGLTETEIGLVKEARSKINEC